MQIIIVIGIIVAIILYFYFARKRYYVEASRSKVFDRYVGVTEDAPGRNFLLVVGILSLVFGPIALIGLIWLSEIGIMVGANVESEVGIAILHAIFRIIIGILGLAFRKNLQYAKGLFVLGWVSIIVTFVLGIREAINIVEIMNSGFGLVIIMISVGLGLIFPILFTVGAGKNLDAYNAAVASVKQSKSYSQTEHTRPAQTLIEQQMCRHCGFNNDIDANFCSHCSIQLLIAQQRAETTPAAFCNQCGWKNEKRLKFCGECGKKLVLA